MVEDRPYSLRQKFSPKNLVFSDISFTAIFAEVTENEDIIDRHLRDIHPLLDYDASESQSTLCCRFDRNKPISKHYMALV